ncbi:basic salivary proline-rich protein 2 isoform X1 [Diaphorina citri]|uniref:Basic salivary proline-rich protein 2 isoform X1 n=1 Tax=Diaphorina citri TaxID=121845 RepID=A0A1S3CTV3_DIACI|nr:basic salivary proline-rich protein 2 isoform X1 [Diaphorina citri]KAI5699639.1 hypothetical protein M8J75_006192 [Diaphorina citri]KAI5726646.1 hypothetical protein M8J76_006179 [Diaphorina citri]KAI5731757.1 hypothetical protein M8J77_015519 [Diaphorina citri]
MKLYLFILVTFVLTAVSLAQDDNNFEEEGAPPAPASSILARARGRALPGKPQAPPKPALDNKLKKAATTAAPPPPPPQNDADQGEELPEGEQEGDYIDSNVEASSAKPTEAPKKIGQGARPFRSNQDLLEALKRRREQRVYVPPPSTTTSFTPVQIPEKQPKPPRSKYAASKGNFSPSQEQAFDNSKKSNSRSFNKKATQPPVPVEEELEEPTQAPKGRSFGGRSRRL